MKNLQRSIASEFPCAKCRHNNNESVYVKERLSIQEITKNDMAILKMFHKLDMLKQEAELKALEEMLKDL